MQKYINQALAQTSSLPAKAKTALAVSSTLLFTTPIFAQEEAEEGAANVGNFFIPTTSVSQFSITSFGEFIGAILSFLFLIAGVLVFVYLVWGGLQWLTSGGDSSATQAARDRITAALVGLAIIALAYAIVQIVQAFFGIEVVGDSSGNFPTPWTPAGEAGE